MNFTAWTTYPLINNSTVGLDGLFNYTTQSMSTVPGAEFVGANAVGLLLFIPLFLIIYFPVSRYDSLAAFTVSSFVCWILSVYMMANMYVGAWVMGLLLGVWLVGALVYYLKTRQ